MDAAGWFVTGLAVSRRMAEKAASQRLRSIPLAYLFSNQLPLFPIK
jgi:hypothetical protein